MFFSSLDFPNLNFGCEKTHNWAVFVDDICFFCLRFAIFSIYSNLFFSKKKNVVIIVALGTEKQTWRKKQIAVNSIHIPLTIIYSVSTRHAACKKISKCFITISIPFRAHEQNTLNVHPIVLPSVPKWSQRTLNIYKFCIDARYVNSKREKKNCARTMLIVLSAPNANALGIKIKTALTNFAGVGQWEINFFLPPFFFCDVSILQ